MDEPPSAPTSPLPSPSSSVPKSAQSRPKPPQPKQTSQTYQQPLVVIIGGGISGLITASDLLSSGHTNLLILEARPRPGGRINTLSLKTANGVPYNADEGAAWIHGISEDNPMLEYVEEGNVNVVSPVNPWMHPSPTFPLFIGGRTPSQSSVLNGLRQFSILIYAVNMICKAGYGIDGTGMRFISVKEALEVVRREGKEELGIIKVKDMSGESRAVVRFLVHMLELWMGGSLGDLQVEEFGGLRDEGWGELPAEPSFEEYRNVKKKHRPKLYGDFDGPHGTVKGGMGRIVEEVMRREPRLEEKLLLGNVVEEIDYSFEESENIRVKVKGGETYDAALVVNTMPLGCLKNGTVEFRPRLPNWKTEGFKNLKCGKYKKILLEFEEIFWPVDQEIIGLVRITSPVKTKLEKNRIIDIGDKLFLDNLWVKDGIPVIEAVLVGDSARNCEGRSDKDIIRCVLELMKMNMQPELKFGKFVNGHVSRWEEDEFSLGAYSYFGLGATERDIDALRKRIGKGKKGILWAGEATNSEYQGSVHGAIISGHEAAKECQGLLEGEDFIGVDDDAEEKRFWGDFCKAEEVEEEDEL
ncbi:hypothetical protein TrST_g2423 [Triparma strigata]|uniref:Amine oxidase domain-containing protein n=1 Tax=Triparma strigata TaxID=1606541 RepID=A0A9W6ZRD8_9STRA|nr:hypothetical protein TrST_g2423 [Triparma strigata]